MDSTEIIKKIRAKVKRLCNNTHLPENSWDRGCKYACEEIMFLLSDIEKEERRTNPTIQKPKEQPFKVGDKVIIVEDRKVYKRGIIEKIGTNKNGTPRVIVNTETGSSWIGHPDLLVFDTTQEQPVCEDLKKRASEIYPNKEGDLCSLHSTLQRGGYIRGYQDCKEQMMRSAVEGEVEVIGITYIDLSDFGAKKLGLVDGQKVKLIIVKEDKK